MVAFGLVVTGVGTLAMLSLAARSLPSAAYADFVVWWTVATLLGTSFGVFEVYLARLLISDLTAGRSHHSASGLMIGRAGVMVGVLSVGLLMAAPVLAQDLFSGELAPALLLPVFMSLMAMQALQRGASTGRHDFVAIAVQLATDGVARAAVVGALVALGADSVTTLSLGCSAAVVVSIVVASRRLGPWLARPRVRGKEVPFRPVLLLLVGSAGPLLANNGSVPWLRSIEAVSPHVLGAFAGAVTLSRIPTQFVSAVMSPLLAHLSSSVEAQDEAAFRRVRRTADTITAVLGVIYVLVFAGLGQLALALLLGPDFTLGMANLAVLAAASSGMFVAVVQQAALGALDRWHWVALAWGAATVTFMLVLALPGDALWRATLAPLVGVGTALVIMWLFGRNAWTSTSRHSVARPAG
ncbi:MAG: hypothetical protein ABIQ15_08920 [Nocardioides sp.]